MTQRVTKNAKQLADLTQQGLALALDLQQNGNKDDAIVVLLANILTATIHQTTLLEAIAVESGIDIEP